MEKKRFLVNPTEFFVPQKVSSFGVNEKRKYKKSATILTEHSMVYHGSCLFIIIRYDMNSIERCRTYARDRSSSSLHVKKMTTGCLGDFLGGDRSFHDLKGGEENNNFLAKTLCFTFLAVV